MKQVTVSPFVKRQPSRNLFEDFFAGINEVIGNDFVDSRPTVNVVENEDTYSLKLAAPGLEKKDFELNIDKNLLTISVEKEIETTEGERYTRREFSYNKFIRSFRLPKTVKTEDISAAYKNGILTVTLPKKEEAKELPPRKVKIS